MQLSASNRPVLIDNERFHYIINVALQDRLGTLYLTSHRLTFVDKDEPRTKSIEIALRNIERTVPIRKGFIKSSPKITFYATKQRVTADVPQNTNTYICAICYYSNLYPPVLPCLTCGVMPSPEDIQSEQSTTKNGFEGEEDENDGIICPKCTFVNHPSLHLCELCSTTLRSPVTHIPATTNEFDSYKFSFRQGGEKTFLDKFQEVYLAKTWQESTISEPSQGTTKNRSQTKKPNANALNTVGGIGHLQASNDEVLAQNYSTLTVAFSDLEALMKSAKSVIALAQQLKKKQGAAENNDDNSLEATSLGLSMTTSKNYHVELARQVTDFADSIIDSKGGMISLPDFYGLFNRARSRSGHDLISPLDLRTACNLFDSNRLAMKLRLFESGVCVIQRRNRDEDYSSRQLLDFVRSKPGVGAKDCAVKFNWSVTVALEELESLENQSKLCRDITLQYGLLFWENLISVA